VGPGTKVLLTLSSSSAGYSACFENALRRVAGRQKKNLGEDTSITANVGIGPDGNGFGLKVELV
jgi:osmotically inducible protein OsmC